MSNPATLRPNVFSSTNQPKKKGGRKKGRTPTDWLRYLSRTRIAFKNPLTGKDDIGEVNLVVAIQLILKATQDSDLPSIKEYFDRLDGKPIQKIEQETPIPQIHVFVQNIIHKAGISDDKRQANPVNRQSGTEFN